MTDLLLQVTRIISAARMHPKDGTGRSPVWQECEARAKQIIELVRKDGKE